MVSPIEILPPELFRNVISNLESIDARCLMQVSRAYYALIERMVWNTIELHREDFHVENSFKVLREEESAVNREPIFLLRSKEWQERRSDRETPRLTARFLELFSTHTISANRLDEGRKSHLGALVTWLCLTIQHESYDVPPDTWNCFAKFTNLEYLEISAFWIPRQHCDAFSAPDEAPKKLRTLKLRGYLPREFVQWLLKNPENCQELQLGVLDFPVSSHLVEPEHQSNPIPPGMQIPENLEDLSVEEQEKWEDVDDLDQQIVAPRALACLSADIMSRMQQLRKLYLYKPSSFREGYDEPLYFSDLSDHRILEEWDALIRATCNTLEYIILDSRPVAEENEADGTGNNEYMWINANGDSYVLFTEMVLPTLLESQNFPFLKKIRLFGFERQFENMHFDGDHREIPDESVQIPSQLRAAFPDAVITVSTCYSTLLLS